MICLCARTVSRHQQNRGPRPHPFHHDLHRVAPKDQLFKRNGADQHTARSEDGGHRRQRVPAHIDLAKSDAAASGLFNEMRIDVHKTPLINWSWKVERGLHDKDERSKPGDDYPARIYVVFSGGIAFWKT